MEEWIRERGYVMWLGAMGLAAAPEEPRDEVRASRDGQREPAPREQGSPRADEAHPTR
jgi:hypothetical protein